MRKLIVRIRHRLADERGVALVVGVGISVVLGIVGTTVMEYSTSNLHSANRSRADEVAFALAEAGLGNATSLLGNPSNDPHDASLLPQRTTTYTTGTATWWGTFDSANNVWTLYATGEAPSSPTPVRRTLSEKVRLAPTLTAPQPNRSWDYLYATRTGSTCDENVASNVSVGSPIYTNGTLCISAGGSVTGAVAVRRQLTLVGTSSIVGSSSTPVPSAKVALGCKYSTAALHTPCSSADNVWASSYDTTVPFYTPPAVPWSSWYANASPGPAHPCTTASGVVPVFENETSGATMNNSVPTSFSLTPAASYSCKAGTGEISWDASSRTLTINGTVFVDGSVKIDNAQVNTFSGQGTLYLSGTFLVAANTKLCGKVAANGTDCDMGGWDPAQALLVVLANGNGGQVPVGYSAQISASAGFQGAIYATGAITIGNYAQVKGPMIATTIVFGAYSQTYTYGPLTSMPAGTPGTTPSTGRLLAPESFSG